GKEGACSGRWCYLGRTFLSRIDRRPCGR
ncbi:thioesterase, partial [Nannochloropsis oceanica]